MIKISFSLRSGPLCLRHFACGSKSVRGKKKI